MKDRVIKYQYRYRYLKIYVTHILKYGTDSLQDNRTNSKPKVRNTEDQDQAQQSIMWKRKDYGIKSTIHISILC